MKKNKSYYLQNLSLFRKKNPYFANQLQLVPFSTQHIKKTSPTNLWVKLEEGTFPIYSENLTNEEAIRSENVNHLIIYGIGLGLNIDDILYWLEKLSTRRVVFIEDDLGVFYYFLHSQKASKILSHNRVDFIYFKDKQFRDIDIILLKSLMAYPFRISALKSYHENKSLIFSEIEEKLISECIHQKVLLIEFYKTSPLIYKNFSENLEKVQESYLTASLFNTFKDIPAIICGAGPSLDKDAAELKNLSDQALIFAGGRALSVLNNYLIEPHFTVGLDPFEEHLTTFSYNNFFELPLIYRFRMFHLALKLAHGPKLFSNGAEGYPLINWAENKLHLDNPTLDEGCNVVNFSLELAKAFGCNPIILIGCDLAYEGNLPYSSAIPDDLPLPSPDLNESDVLTLHRGYIQKDKDGKPVFTLWKWLKEAEWIENFVLKNKELTIINSSSSGMKIKNIETLNIQEVKKRFLCRSLNLKDFVHLNLSNSQKASFTNRESNELKKEINQKLTSSYQISDLILKELNTIIENPNHPKAQLALHEYEFQNEVTVLFLKNLEQQFERIERNQFCFEIKRKKYLLFRHMLNEYLKIFI